ncbi:LIC12162 family protein [Burkholderiales bacterium]|nr:LIC12162 family protein [Burkholderiales bacterium]
MTNKGRFLITTALESTWNYEEPVLFLGEWARLYHRRRAWRSMDALVVDPVGMNHEQRKSDFENIRIISDRLLKDLAASLDRHHGETNGERFWRILLGHWVMRYVSLAFNRYKAIEQALANYKISGSATLNLESYTLSTVDSLTFYWATNDHLWNHIFYERTIKHLGGLNSEVRPPDRIYPSEFSFVQPTNKLKNGSRERFVSLIRYLCSKFKSEKDAVIIDAHLPRVSQACLQLSFWQIPQFWGNPRVPDVAVDMTQRKGLVDVSVGDSFERFSRELLLEVLPRCYLEGYPALRDVVDNLPWPKTPKFIYTAGAFDTNETFKLWTAKKVGEGRRYFAGQHGAGYNSHRYLQTFSSPELLATDGFLTWGWARSPFKAIPAFLFNKESIKSNQRDQCGGLLVVGAAMLHRMMHYDNYYEFGLYQEEQFSFVGALPEYIRRNLIFRLHSSSSNFEWNEEQRWRERDPSIRVEKGLITFAKQLAKSRLVVFAYDSTGILQCLSLNRPMICFWRDDLNHISEESKVHYQKLIDVGILCTNPQMAAARVIEVWESIDEWWNDPCRQKVVMEFRSKFANPSTRPVRELRAILSNIAVD